ncbi:MAG: GNAT family N-acetyltransferase [Woeseiaceae bacterium]
MSRRRVMVLADFLVFPDRARLSRARTNRLVYTVRGPRGRRNSNMTAPIVIETERLILRRPLGGDAAAIFTRYAADPDVTRYLAWPMHRSLEDTLAFIEFSDNEWERWPAGPLVVCLRADGEIIGSTGIAFETAERAATGYVFAKDQWGKGYATESVGAILGAAARHGERELYALFHPHHAASRRVLEKSGFVFERRLHAHLEFPNFAPGVPADVECYVARPDQ